MFEVGFWELVLIAVVALLVVGPERLPALARTVGRYVGKMRRVVAQVRDDIEREIRADELKKSLDEANALREAYDEVDQTKRELDEAVGALDEARANYERYRGEETVSGSTSGAEDGETPGPGGEDPAPPVVPPAPQWDVPDPPSPDPASGSVEGTAGPVHLESSGEGESTPAKGSGARPR